MANGLHIVIEGPDGVGKSTQIKRMVTYFSGPAGGSRVVTSHRNPGATPLGQEIRKLVKNRQDIKIDRYTEQVLMAADLCAYLVDIVKPRVAAGEIVISDRSNFVSGMMYSLAGGLDLSQVDAFHTVALATNPPPMHVLVMHADYDIIRARQHDDAEGACKIESRGPEYHKAVNAQYKKLVNIAYGQDRDVKTDNAIVTRLNKFVSYFNQADRGRYSIWAIDASRSEDEVEGQIRTVLEKLVGLAS